MAWCAAARGTYVVDEGIGQDVIVGGQLREAERMLLRGPGGLRRHRAGSRTELERSRHGEVRVTRRWNQTMRTTDKGTRTQVKEWTKGTTVAPLQLRRGSKRWPASTRSEPARRCVAMCGGMRWGKGFTRGRTSLRAGRPIRQGRRSGSRYAVRQPTDGPLERREKIGAIRRKETALGIRRLARIRHAPRGPEE